MVHSHVCYFMLKLALADARRAGALLRDEEAQGAFRMPDERLHLTIAGLGAYGKGIPQALIDLAIAAGDAVALAPFTCAFDRLQGYGSPGNGQGVELARDTGPTGMLHDLHAQLHGGLVRLAGGVPPWLSHRRLRPHVTLCYARRRGAGAGRPVWHRSLLRPWELPVAEFVLVDSLHGVGEHVVLKRWTLAGHKALASGQLSLF